MIKQPIKKLQSYLKEHALDAFLILTKLNRQYVSGFTGSMGAVVVTKKSAELFVDARYTIRATRESPLPVKPFNPITPLKRPGKIGIEDKITVREFQKLKKDYTRVKFIVTNNVIENLRAVKSGQETKFIKTAQKINDKIFAAIKKWPLMKMTEIEVSQKMERLAIKLGADSMAFESIVAWGPNAAAPHHLSSNQKIKRNNFLLLDFGALVKGYHSDFTRTLFIGQPSRKQEKIYNTVLEAQERGIAKVRTGNKGASVDDAARNYIKKADFGPKFTHNTGHGVGLEIHELPNFSPKSEDVLQSGMIVTVEPGIYIENWGGVRVEDMILVADKPVQLSRSPKDLKSMIIE